MTTDFFLPGKENLRRQRKGVSHGIRLIGKERERERKREKKRKIHFQWQKTVEINFAIIQQSFAGYTSQIEQKPRENEPDADTKWGLPPERTIAYKPGNPREKR